MHKPLNINKNSKNLPIILQKILFTYKNWCTETKNLSKMHRYSIGIKINNLFLEIIENIFTAFIEKEKEIYIRNAIVKNDLLKFEINLLFELQEINQEKFLKYSIQLEEIGKILFGWKNKNTSRRNER